MKCQVLQRRLLSSANPEQVPADLCAHLARCKACREWHNELVLLERHIPLLPVPSSKGKTRMLHRLLQDHTVSGHAALTVAQASCLAPPSATSPAPLSLRPRTLLLGVAAALLLIVLGWLGLQSWLQAAVTPPSKPGANALLGTPPTEPPVDNPGKRGCLASADWF
jgi:hypothetical protein